MRRRYERRSALDHAGDDLGLWLGAGLQLCPHSGAGGGIKRAPDDNGIQLAELPRNRRGPTALYRANRFDRIGRAHNIEHRLTKPNHAWTSGQVERMNRTLKEATVKHCHFDSHDQLRDHFAAFLNAYNFARLPM